MKKKIFLGLACMFIMLFVGMTEATASTCPICRKVTSISYDYTPVDSNQCAQRYGCNKGHFVEGTYRQHSFTSSCGEHTNCKCFYCGYHRGVAQETVRDYNRCNCGAPRHTSCYRPYYTPWNAPHPNAPDDPRGYHAKYCCCNNLLATSGIGTALSLHVWEVTKTGGQATTIYNHSDSNMVPNHCPEVPNGTLTGNLLNKLFYVGEKISLQGTICENTITYSPKIEKRYCRLCGARSESRTQIPPENIKYNINISISGVILVDQSGNIIPSQMTMTEKEWSTKDFYIKEWKNTSYSSALGTFYGTITVKSECPESCSKTYYIPGPKPILSNVKVGINIRPSNAGSVSVNYQQLSTNGAISEKTGTISGDRGVIEALTDSGIKISVNASDEYVYINTSQDEARENVITDNKNYSYQIPSKNSELYVNFERMYSVKFESEPVETGTLPSNIDNILPGEEVDVFATPGEGYFFSSWKLLNENREELSIEVKERADGTKYFIMPNESVIVVALFSNKPNGTVKIIIEGEGEVTVDGTKINSGDIVPGEDGTTIDIISKPSNDGCKEIQILDENREVIGTGEEYIYTIDGDTTIIVKFISDEDGKDDKDGKYTLYVTSFYGGDAKIEKVLSKHSGATYKIEKEGPDALGKYVYKIKNVYAGDRFKIGYEVKEEEYSFKNWEYKPYIKPDKSASNGSKGSIEITMPESDLTVTAVFKKDSIEEHPKLSITTNNIQWGIAYTTINGEITKTDEKYNVEIGMEYELVYEAEEGYYFVGWQYSTEETPFVGTDKIRVPNKDLEVMALFSPIPENGPGGYDIIFDAEPAEGGRVPDNLEDIFFGSKVTIMATPNKGYEFDKWEFTSTRSEEKEIVSEYDEITGTGYFIMPDYDIIATAVFKRNGEYKLYVTHNYGGNAWTFYDDNKVDYVENVREGEKYKLEYEVIDPNYEFVRWECRWNEYDGDREAIIKDGSVVIPQSDTTVTAIFKEKVVSNTTTVRVSTSNELWGDAWIVVEGKEYHSEWVEVEVGKDYKVYYKSKDGFKFTNWNMIEYFTEYVFGANESNLNMPNNKIELTAFFEPGVSFSVQVQANPEYSGEVNIDGVGQKRSDILIGDSIKIAAGELGDWKFKHWYIEEDGTKEIISNDSEYNFNMPSKDVVIIAQFDKGEGAYEPSKEHTITVIKEGNGSGNISYDKGNGFIDDSFYNDKYTVIVNKRETIKFKVVPDTDSYVEGWWRGVSKKSSSNEYEIGAVNEDIVISVRIEKKSDDENTQIDSLINSFRIVSVRDLRWKEYFVKGTTLESDNFFGIPRTNTTMLYDVDKYTQPIKMGYAVEFELITEGIKDAELVITPRAYAIGDKSNNLIDRLDTENDDMRDYKEIRISKSSNGKGKFLQYSEDLGEKVNIGGYEIDKNKTLWRWVYYLPADTWLKGGGKDEITVAFDIKLVENGSKKRDIVVNAQKVMSSSWTGDAFKYSLKHSLLEDIYNNAQN